MVDEERLAERNRGGIVGCKLCYRIDKIEYSSREEMARNERRFVMCWSVQCRISKKAPTLIYTNASLLADHASGGVQ